MHFRVTVSNVVGAALFLSANLHAEGPAPVAEHVLVVTPVFAKTSPKDSQRRFDLNFFFPKSVQRPAGVITYNCAITAATYLITTPSGQRHSLSLIDKKDGSNGVERVFWPSSRWEQCLDIVGDCTFTGQGRSSLVWKGPPPAFDEPGEYRLAISGTFHDKLGVAPDFAFQSNEAVWLVDASVVSLDALRAKAQDALEKDIGCVPAGISWRVSDMPSGNRRVGGRLRRSDVPEDLVREAKKEMPSGWVGFGGIDYVFVFSPRGELLSKEHKPHWIFDY
jgi:hypothetical protein